MKNSFILATAISTVIASPLPDVQSEQQQWGDATIPFLLSTLPNDQLVASNPQSGAQTDFKQTNAVEPSMPFAMELKQIAIDGGLPSIPSNEVVDPSTSFDVDSTNLSSSSTIPSTDSDHTQAFSGSLALDANTGTQPAADLTPGSSSLPLPAAAPDPELSPAPDSTLDQALLDTDLDTDSLFDTTGIDDAKDEA